MEKIIVTEAANVMGAFKADFIIEPNPKKDGRGFVAKVEYESATLSKEAFAALPNYVVLFEDKQWARGAVEHATVFDTVEDAVEALRAIPYHPGMTVSITACENTDD